MNALTRRTRKIDGQRTVHEVWLGPDLLVHALHPLSDLDIQWALNERQRPCRPATHAITPTAWINVTDRLPARGSIVLIAFRNKTIATAKFGGRRWIDPHSWHADEEWNKEAITHWMPLPEAPAA